MCYSDFVSDPKRGVGLSVCSEEQLFSLKRSVNQFSFISVNTFENHSDSRLYTVEYYHLIRT